VKFYSGFSLRNEAHFFEPYLKKSDYTVAGFSYGAIKALLHVSRTHMRIDTLQLFSPAFFHDKDDAFKRLQIMSYKNNSQRYLKHFIQGCFAPYPTRDIEYGMHDATQLTELLEFQWDATMLKALCERNIEIEVFLGGKDTIINAVEAKTFFLPYATTYYYKHANHFLLEE
jgi:hypothetical protein